MAPSPLFLWEVWGNFWYLLWEYGWVPERKPNKIVGAHLWHCSELNLQQFITFGSCSPIQTWLVQWLQLVTLCFHKSWISVFVCLQFWGATVFLCAFPSLMGPIRVADLFCFVFCRGFFSPPFFYLLWWQDGDLKLFTCGTYNRMFLICFFILLYVCIWSYPGLI